MNEKSHSEKLNLLVKALSQEAFHFIIIGQNHPSVFKDVFSWLNLHLPGRKIKKLPIIDKNYKEILEDLKLFRQDLVLIPDFDILFKPENERICIGINQRRDFLASEKMNLICFIRLESFKLLPGKIPDLWSLRSLELEFVYTIKAEKFQRKIFSGFQSSLGGRSYYEKAAEISRLKRQIQSTDNNNISLHKALESQIAMLNFELDQLPHNDIFERMGLTEIQDIDETSNISDNSIRNDDQDQILLSVFALLPAEPISLLHLEALLPGFNNLKETLYSFIEKGWIDYYIRSDSYKCLITKRDEIRYKNKDQLVRHSKSLISVLIEKLDFNINWDSRHFLNATYSETSIFVKYAENVVQYIGKADIRVAILAKKIGDFHLTTDKLEKALVFYEQYNEISQELIKTNPQNISYKIEMTTSFEKLGDVHTAMTNLQKAHSFYKENMRFCQELLNANKGNSTFKNLLAYSYSKNGDNLTSLGNFSEALSCYEKFSELQKELYDSAPNNLFFKHRLTISYEKLGETDSLCGNIHFARVFFYRGLELSKELFNSWPQNVTFKNGLAISYAKIGIFYQEHQFDDEAAHDYFQKAELLWKDLVEDYPNYAEFGKNLKDIRDLIET